MQSLFRDLVGSLRSPEFWAMSCWLDIVVRSRQSRLGIFWLVSPAIIYIWGMGAFFASMMGAPLTEFATYVGVGYLVFRMVNSAITESTGTLAASAPFILDGHVRLTDFVLKVIANSSFHFLISLPVVVVALLIHPDPNWSGVLLSFVTLPVVLLNALWIGVVFALVGARFPDLRHFVSNIFMFAFLLTPIIWSAELMPPGSLRGTLMRFNPFYHLVELVRAPILGQQIDALTPVYLATMTLGGGLLAAFVYRRYARYVPLWI